MRRIDDAEDRKVAHCRVGMGDIGLKAHRNRAFRVFAGKHILPHREILLNRPVPARAFLLCVLKRLETLRIADADICRAHLDEFSAVLVVNRETVTLIDGLGNRKTHPLGIVD